MSKYLIFYLPQVIMPILKIFLALTMHSVWKMPHTRSLEAWQVSLGFYD